jgi:penicillin amidase
LVSASVIAALVAGYFVTRSETQADRLRALARESLSTISGELRLPGLKAPVEVIRDRWGVPHIYAENVDDLFMAQGFVMAQDRLWQMEMWRRQVEGRLAEILGQQAVARDRTARLMQYRGPMDDREWTSYHPEGRRIFTAYAAGVNAFIDASAGNLPLEFKLTGIKPDRWTAETVVRRVATMGNASSEMSLARNVARLGVEQANRQSNPDPPDNLVVPDGLDLAAIDQGAEGGRGAGRGGGGGGGRGGGGNTPEIIEPYRSWISGRGDASAGEIGEPGSNNWVVSGKLSATGKPIVANDPHRTVTNPSLRYISHLVAPGWNVIGASEPPFVGVAIGHNDRLGWGLTIVGTDQEDVYVEDVNPANPNEVKWGSGWEPLRVVREEILVKGGAPVVVELKYSRHGPIFQEDPQRHRAYALRSALLEPGTAPYLGGLRLAQAKDCKQFLAEAMYWKSPSENLICGDVDGNISWQASALTPNRANGKWSGRLPVPGDGRYEWTGFRNDLPRELNPARGFVATANHNIHPKDFKTPIMFKSAANIGFDRIDRLLELIQPGRQYTIDDHRRMQLDAMHMRGRAEVPLFRGWTASQAEIEKARSLVAAWDGMLLKDSAAAAIFMTWREGAPADERDVKRPVADRKSQHEASLARAIETLKQEQGADWSSWRWGRMHTRSFPHSLVAAFNLDTVERPGGGGTVAADGASYREILDVADWDRSIVTNVPGQSAQPESPFYGNLLPLWASDTYFPLVYSRPRVQKESAHTLRLRPK